ncbi:UrvD/REP family ATP-dependent DNA helicase [Brachybacterium endophyticum]|uniref:UrvD/REP family ATP-dependent DNA helicase n=1 Tax=Brachybacterium endophyticum TaxID=2182385 RepID=UPI001F0B845F|nr:UrvD/REP family ATP-dependent DNA helicase [Brachybacterium endophyticum]
MQKTGQEQAAAEPVSGTSAGRRGGSSFEELTVLPPDRRRLPAALSRADLDADQTEALDAFTSGEHVLVHGVPGAGRTSLALTAALDLAHRDGGSGRPASASATTVGNEVLLLSPRRAAADPLRDAVALAGAAASVRVATPPAHAFAVVRAAAIARGQGEPSLVTGADQDALLSDLIADRQDWSLSLEASTRALPGFRTELRDVITRAEELGIGPDALRTLALQRGRPAWLDAAEILRDYLDVLDLQSMTALDAGPRLDSGALVRRGSQLLGGLDPRHLPRAVVVDDAQDLTAAGVDLVLALARAGSRVMVTSCPDQMVDSFRGAVADAAARIRDGLPRAPREVALARSRRDAVPAPAIDALRGRLPLAGSPSSLRRPLDVASDAADAPAATEPGVTEPAAIESDAGPSASAALRGLSVLTLADAEEEARVIAGALRDLHHEHAVAYDEMAVVCRSGGTVRELADQLARAGLAVSTPQRLPALREEPVVLDLLRIVELGIDGGGAGGEDVRGDDGAGTGEDGGTSEDAGIGDDGGTDDDATDEVTGSPLPLSPAEAVQLLRGPFGDADDLRLRRIRRTLLDSDRADATPSAEDSGRLLARALLEERTPGLEDGGGTATPLLRVRRMIRAVRELGPAPAAADALWAAWEAAHLADGWQRAALGEDHQDADGARARLTAHRLDAVGALFAAVDRFTERRGQADALVFIDQVRGQAVAEDTLAPRAEPTGRVAVLTPAQLAGAERDTVVLARVQEGAWPNVRLRSTLFGAAELSLLGTGVHGEELPLEPAALRAVQRESVVADELRLAVSALTRARSRVLVTAVDGGEFAPSALVPLLAGRAGEGWVDRSVITEDPGPAPDPRRLVAALRRRLNAGDDEERARAAVLLHDLHEAGIPGADPGSWYHQRPSSESPVLDPDLPVRLSPSALERAHACPLAWLLERAGGSRPSGPAQLVGTAVHRLAQENPTGVAPERVEDLVVRLQTLLRPLRLEETWSGRRTLRRAEDSVRLLNDYLGSAPPAAAIEAPFEYRLGGVVLRGAIDRIEGGAGPGQTLRIVDLKTGRAPKKAADVEEDLQLGAYQTAVDRGALADELGPQAPQHLAGGQLVYVGTGSARPALRTQTALASAEDPDWFSSTVESTAGAVSGSRMTARRNAHCDTCSVRRICPLWPEGAEL